MSDAAPARPALAFFLLLIASACAFFPGIRWGLPSRDADAYLFGDRPAWSGQQIESLAPPQRLGAGADVDVNPLNRTSAPIVLNETDAQRAEIIRRYRLYSYQPDEMITFMALSRLPATRGDPQLYQYGGLWIYPVGALLGAGRVLHLVDLRSDKAWYIDHPEAFGRFYVVARLYSAAWGIVGIFAVFWILRRITGSAAIAMSGAVATAFMPVVVNMAHEAKPHLGGAALMLLAVIAATKYVETGRARWWIAAGVACGAAFGMVISALVIFSIIPVMVLMRRQAWRERAMIVCGAALIGAAVYLLTNPYVAINAAFHPDILRSNFANSTAMYRPGAGGLGNALWLMLIGTSPAVLCIGIIGAAALVGQRIVPRWRQRCQGSCAGRGDAAWLIVAPAVLICIQFALLAEGKPGEYARFALLPDMALAIAAFAAIDRFVRGPALRATWMALLPALTALFAVPYIAGFVFDSTAWRTRLFAAQNLSTLPVVTGDIGLALEPAPYSCPPINLFDRCLILLPSGVSPGEAGVDFALRPVDWPVKQVDQRVLELPLRRTASPPWLSTPISWAGKRFEITVAPAAEPHSPATAPAAGS